MAKCNTIKTLAKSNFRRLTDVKCSTFDIMLSILTTEIERNKRIKGRPSVLTVAVLNLVQKSICILILFVCLNAWGQEKQKKNIYTKQLRFLYHSNGGMIGYFDDGTVVGCPKCDFCKSNIERMFSSKVMGNYDKLKNGILLVDGSKNITPNWKKDKGWVLINYQWFEKVSQY